MPRVPTYTQRVQTAPLPGVRRQARETPDSLGAATGEALSRAGEQFANVGFGLLAQHIQAGRDRADELAVQNADTQLAQWELSRLHDPQSGVLHTVKGKDAANLHTVVGQEFEDTAATIESGLTTDRQRMAFARIKSQRRDVIQRTLDDYGARELDAYDQQETKAALTTSASAAIANATDLERVNAEVARTTALVQAAAARNGLGPDATAALLSDSVTKIHAGVIDRMLALDQDQAAQAYYTGTKDQIDGPTRIAVEKALEEGSLRGNAQRTADDIIAAGGTLSTWREKVREIQDPKLRDAVQQRIEHESDVRDKLERDAAESTLLNAYNLVERGGLRAIPPAMWATLPGSQRSALRSYAEQKAQGVPIKTDYRALYTLITLASTDPDTFAKTNLLAYRNQLSNGDLEQMMRDQAAVRKGGRSESDLFTSQAQQNQIVDAALQSMGLVLTDADQKKPENKGTLDRIVAFRRAVREAVDRQKTSNGNKPATDQQVQAIIDTLIAPTSTTGGGFFTSGTPAYAFETAQAQVTKVVQVPIAERRKIEAALRSHGLPVTDAAIVKLFNQQLTRVRGDR